MFSSFFGVFSDFLTKTWSIMIRWIGRVQTNITRQNARREFHDLPLEILTEVEDFPFHPRRLTNPITPCRVQRARRVAARRRGSCTGSLRHQELLKRHPHPIRAGIGRGGQLDEDPPVPPIDVDDPNREIGNVPLPVHLVGRT